jgi:Lrp/AsnC family leucine-responsive transcriptional regulator
MELDKFDLAILAVLQQDARASLQDISARVGLSTTPCWTRIKKMETEGVIQDIRSASIPPPSASARRWWCS